MDLTAQQIAPPKHWEEFEELALALYARVWRDDAAKRNGRSGQAQQGTDITGTPQGTKDLHGVQCKGKDSHLGAVVTKAEFDAEVAKADKFKPALAHWTLVTTAPKDARLEEHVRQVSDARRANGQFTVDIASWEDLQAMIANYPDVIERFYPSQSPRIVRLIDRLEGKPNDASLSEVHRQVKAEVQQFQKQHAVKEPIALSIEGLMASNDKRQYALDDVAKALLAGDAVVIDAEPGAGKTTTLLQIADRLLALSSTSAPLIVPLGEKLDVKADLTPQIFSRARLRPVGQEVLNNLALAGRFTFLCDGWNERTPEERAWLQIQFNAIRRDYSECGLLVTTRRLSPLTIAEETRVRIRPLSFDQQLALLQRIHPDAEKLLRDARNIPRLHSIVQNPFYLNALAEVAPAVGLPDTKEAILSAFVVARDKDGKHQEPLRKAFDGTQGVFMADLAYTMSRTGANSAPQGTAIETVARTAKALTDAGRLDVRTIPSASDALDVLVGHHLMVVIQDERGERKFGFQHQQITEWYTSRWLEDVAEQSLAAVLDYVDRGDSGEALYFLAERMSRGAKEKQATLGKLIVAAFDVDPQLAANLIHRSTSDVWGLIANDVSAKLATLEKRDAIAAVRFMGRSGRPEFANRIFAAISTKDGLEKISTSSRGWLRPSALGADGAKRVAGLEAGLARSIAWDLCFYTGEDGVEFAKESALAARSDELALVVIESFEFEGDEKGIEEFAAAMPPELLNAVTLKIPLSRAPASLRDRFVAARTEQAKLLDGPGKFHALQALKVAGSDIDGEELVALALTGGFKEYHQNREAIDFAAANYPEIFQRQCIETLTAGKELSNYADDAIQPSAAIEDAMLKLFGRNTRNERRDVQIAKTFTKRSVHVLLDELDSTSAKVAAGAEGEELKALNTLRANLSDGICTAEPREVAAALLERKVERAEQVNDYSEIIFRLKGLRDDEKELVLPEAQVADLIRMLASWASFFQEPRSACRSFAGHYATALAVVPVPELIPALDTAIRYELAEIEVDAQERAETQATGKRPAIQRNRSGYWMVLRNAAGKFKGDAARDLLRSHLRSPMFCEGAVFELIPYASTKPRGEGINGPGFSLIKIQRARPPVATHPIAAEVMARIDELLAAGDTFMAEKFARAAAQMDFGNDAGPIYRAAEAIPNPEGRHDLLHVMLAFGLQPDPKMIAAGYECARDRYFGAKWQDPRGWWEVRRWLELLAASDAPELVVQYVKELSDQYRTLYQLREVIGAVGSSPSPNAPDTLIALSEAVPDCVGEYEWEQSVARLKSERCARYLLDFTFAAPTGKRRINGFSFHQVVARQLEAHSVVRAEFLDRLLKADPVPPLAPAVLQETIEPRDVPRLFDAVKGETDGVAVAILRGMGEAAISREPIDESANTYEIVPVDLTDLRKWLFAEAQGKGARAKLAHRVLTVIEEQREAFGRPAGERRHPDHQSGMPWPMNPPGD